MRSTKVLVAGICTVAIGVGVGAIPSRADESSDLKAEVRALRAALDAVQKRQQDLERKSAQRQAAAQAAPIPVKSPFETSHPGYLRVPGTETLLKIGGYVKVDGVYDLKSTLNGTAANFGDIPLEGTPQSKRNPNFGATARESRFNITTLTPTQFGELKTFIEGDFYGAGGNAEHSNSYGFRLRHAYFEVGPWLAGQNWTTFSDLETVPETLEFNGPAGFTLARQALVRYTTALGPGALSLALENSSSDAQGATNVWPDLSNGVNFAPEGVVRWKADPSWGHVAVAGLAREISIDTGGVTNALGVTGKSSTFGWGVLGALGIKTIGRDQLSFQAVAGEGIGRYLNNAADDNYQGASVNLDGSLRATPAYGATVSYLHHWSDWIRTTVAYAHTAYDRELPRDPFNSIRSLDSLHANLIFVPLTNTVVGFEYIYGHIQKEAFDPATGATGRDGWAHRIQTSAIVKF